MKKRIIVTLLTLSVMIIFISYSNESETIIKSYADGPYIANKGDSISIIFQKSDFSFDSLSVSKEYAYNTKLECLFDSINCPALTFQLHPKSDDTDNVFSMPDKLFAISDIEGDYEKYYQLLISNNIIDTTYNWVFGNGHLVIVGDLMDRGNYVTQCLWLTYHLEEEAKKHGGKVHYLLGNHEQLVLLGYDVYCSPKYLNNFKILELDISQLFSSNTLLGSWIRNKNSIIKIGDLLFVHGGISPSIQKYNLSLDQMNNEIRRDIATQNFMTDESAALLTGEGIIWYRGLIEAEDNYEKISESELDEILIFFDCKSIIIGHTPVEDISADFSGKVIRLNVMYYDNNSALYIENGKKYIVDDKKNKIEL